MGVRRILTYPETSLKDVAEDVSNITGDTIQTIEDMAKTMYAAPGIGLAAPQIGVAERMIVLDIGQEDSSGEHKPNLIELINPEIREHGDDLITYEEGCLSVIDYRAEVTRPEQILVVGWTRDQKEIQIEADGLLSVCLQHEIDHLDGTLFLDRLSRLKRNMYAKRVKKALREGRPISREDD